MSTNCLVTKLKASVNNDDLQRFGMLKMFVNAEGSTIPVYAVKEGDIPIEIVCTGTTSITSGEGTIEPVVTGVGNIYISDKYKLIRCGLASTTKKVVDFDDLMYAKKIQYISFYRTLEEEVNIKNLTDISQLAAFEGLKELIISEQNYSPSVKLSGTIEQLANTPSGKTLTKINITDSNITGTMAQLGKLESLTTIARLTNNGALSSPNFTGTVESFVNTRRNLATPQTTGTVTWDNPSELNGSVTFNGAAITGGVGVVLSWTATTITFNGVTITA